MITITNLSKKIKKNTVLQDITYSFYPGNIYGLIGTNGSGKTMLLRAIAGLIHASQGEIKIDDKILSKDCSFPESLGIIIEHMELLPQFDAFTNLKILSKVKKVATDEDIKNALLAVGLDPNSKLKVKKYSLGMKQRLNIAQAIFEKPNIILLDEPTNAIDEGGIEIIHKLLINEKKRGALIIIASHNKNDIENLCDFQLQMKDGKLLELNKQDRTKEKAGK